VVKAARIVIVCALSLCVACASVLGIDDATVTVAEGGAGDATTPDGTASADGSNGTDASNGTDSAPIDAGPDACLYVFLSNPVGPNEGGLDGANAECTKEGQALCPGSTYIAFFNDGGNQAPPGGGTCASPDGGLWTAGSAYWSTSSACDNFTNDETDAYAGGTNCIDQPGAAGLTCDSPPAHLYCQRIQ
jgi:hypothetical protein